MTGLSSGITFSLITFGFFWFILLSGWSVMSSLDIDPGFGHWFAGFTDGEGCFTINPTRNNGIVYYYCRFTIGLRADDRLLLEKVQKTLGIGNVSSKCSPSISGSPQATFSVTKKAECRVLQELFFQFPLRSKKADDFELWSAALDCSSVSRTWTEDKSSILIALKEQMELKRKYREVCPTI